MRIAAIAALTILHATAAAFADPGSTTAGRVVAQEQCARCHVVEEGGTAPDQGANSEAPSFADVARSEHNARSIRVFLRTPHATMPSIVLSTDQIEDVAAYIMSLRSE